MIEDIDLETGTIADELWEEQKYKPKKLSLDEILLEYEEKHHIDNW